MGLSLGGSKSSSKSSMKQTTTPTNPDWVPGQVQTLTGMTANLAGNDPYSFVAGPDKLQTQAAQGAAGLGMNMADYGIANGTYQNLAGSGANTYTPSTQSN